MRNASIHNRPAQYAATYSANARPRPSRNRRSAQSTSPATPKSQISSYRNVGWKPLTPSKPLGRLSGSMARAQGRSVGRPKSSWLK